MLRILKISAMIAFRVPNHCLIGGSILTYEIHTYIIADISIINICVTK